MTYLGRVEKKFIKMWGQTILHKKIGAMVKSLSLKVKVRGSNLNFCNIIYAR
jgi:hypothetical protein